MEDAADAVAGRYGHHRSGDGLAGRRRLVGRCLAYPALLLDLLHEVGDANLPGAAGVESGLNGRADVIGVDVAVPQAVAAHHDDGVADAGPHVLEGRDGLVVGFEHVHDFVTEVADRRPLGLDVPPQRRTDGRRGRERLRLGHRPTIHDVKEDVEQQDVARGAGVNDPRLLQHGQQLGRPGQRRFRRRRRRLQHTVESVAVGGRCPGGRGGLTHNCENRALDRPHHGAIGRLAGLAQGFGEGRPVDGVGLLDGGGHPPEELGENDARVPAGAHQRAVADRLAHGAHVLGAVELGHNRFEGESHVGAGVSVGYRVDIEPVQLLLVRPQRVAVAQNDLAQVRSVKALQCGHGEEG